MDHRKIDRDVIVVIYSLMLKHGLSAMDIYEMSMDEYDKPKIEVLVLTCVLRQKHLNLKAQDLISLVPRISLFLTKYCGALNA